MRILLAVAFAVILTACSEETIILDPSDNPEFVMIVVTENGKIFMSTRNSSLSINELPKEISRLLGEGDSYNFVIQSDEDGSSYAKKIEKVLHNSGVKERHVAIALSKPRNTN